MRRAFKSAAHEKWHRRVEGQIMDAMAHHPEWFSDRALTHKKSVARSIAKRIVGEIVADAVRVPCDADGLSDI